MADPDSREGVVIDYLTPEETFERLAHEIRLRTLRTLNEDGPITHATLRKRVGVDDSGQFNYHLQKLNGQFIYENDDGYGLTPAGRRVVGAVLSGGYTGDLAGETVPADADCLRCDGPLATHIEDGGVYVSCQDCDQKFNGIDIPPGVLEGCELTDLYELVDRWVKHRLTAALYGFCHRCNGQVDRRVVRIADDDAWEGRDSEWLADLPVEALLRHQCTRCGDERHALVASVAVLHPAVVGFHHEHGINIRETPLTDLDWLEMGMTSVESRRPLVVSVPVAVDGDALTVSFDADFSLVDERRS